MNSILNLLFEFSSSYSCAFIRAAAAAAATFISIGIAMGVAFGRGRIRRKSKGSGGDGKEAVFDGFEGAVDDCVYCVYDFVDEGLIRAQSLPPGGKARDD